MNSDAPTDLSVTIPMSPQQLAKRANAILRVMATFRASNGLKEAVDVVLEEFVERETNSELRRLGEVLAMARLQAVIQNQLDDDRQALHHGELSHEEHISTGHHYEMLRHQACTYNHLLRGFIEASGHYVSRAELQAWLTTASSGREAWAKGEITGAVSEIALHAALQGVPEIRNLRYGTVEEDLIGYDFVGEWQGNLLTIDAKTGFYAPLGERKRGHRHLEISVPREAVKDLQVNHRGLALLRREVRQVLLGNQGAEIHASHSYYRPVSA